MARKRFKDMNLDVISMILSLLRPDDLLRLLTVFEFLRGFLSCEASNLVWKMTEKSCSLPDCPEDLTHLQYAKLIFGDVCTLCNESPRGLKLFFAFRVRLCKDCAAGKVEFARRSPLYTDLMMRYKSESNDVFWLDPAVSVANCAGATRHVVRWDLVRSVGLCFDHQDKCCVFYAPTFRPAYERFSSLPDAERRKYASERRELVVKIKEHALLVEQWENDRAEEHRLGNERLRTAFRNEVIRLLKESGYTDRDLDERIDDNGIHRKWKALVEATKTMNPDVWRLLYPKLQDVIQSRRVLALQGVVKKRRGELAWLAKDIMFTSNSPFITVDDLALLPLARRILDDADHRVSFTFQQLEILKTQALSISTTFLRNFEDRCARLLLESQLNGGYSSSEFPDKSILHSRTSFFLFRPSPQHLCLEILDFNRLLEAVIKCSGQPCQGIWIFDNRVYVPPFSMVLALIKAVRVPALTHTDMLKFGQRFRCLRCGFGPVAWVDLVKHFAGENMLLSFAYGPRRGQILAPFAGNIHFWDERKGPLARLERQGFPGYLEIVNNAKGLYVPDEHRYW